MATVNITPANDDVMVAVKLNELDENCESPEFLYLAAIALETYENDSYEIEDTLMEFMRNTAALDIDEADCRNIARILEGEQ